MLIAMPVFTSRSVKSALVNWLPWSVLKIFGLLRRGEAGDGLVENGGEVGARGEIGRGFAESAVQLVRVIGTVRLRGVGGRRLAELWPI
jgi:hypothetical protein